MSFINQFSRICFQNCNIKDHLNVTGTAEFRKKVTFKGPVCLTNTLQMSTKELVIHVPKDYPTIQEALDSFAGRHAGCVKIFIAKGEYEETLSLEKFSSGMGADTRDPDDPIMPDRLLKVAQKGVMLIGDTRRRLCAAYINGVEFAGSAGRQDEFLVVTDAAGVGPFVARLASDFGALVATETALAELQVATPSAEGITPPPLDAFGGNAALIDRGTIAFVSKGTAAEASGASMCIVANNNAGAPDENIGMGGGPATVGIPVVDVSYNSGVALKAAIMSNPGMKVKLVNAIGGAYNPPMGTNYGIVALTHPGADRTKIQVSMTSTPIADANILAPPVIEEPNFDDSRVGYRVGDVIQVGTSDYLTQAFVGGGSADLTIVGFESSTEGGHNNIICLDAEVPAGIDITIKGSHFAVMPCVSIKGRDPKKEYTMTVNNCGVSLHGLRFTENTNLTQISGLEGSISVTNGSIAMSSCALTDTGEFLGNGFQLELVNSVCYIFDAYRGGGAAWLYAEGCNGISVVDRSWLGGGSLYSGNSSSNNVTVTAGSSLMLSNLQTTTSGVLWPIVGNSALSVTNARARVTNLLHCIVGWGNGINIGGTGQLFNSACGVRVDGFYRPLNGPANTAAVTLQGTGVLTVADGTIFDNNGSPNVIQQIDSAVRICNNSGGDDFFGTAAAGLGLYMAHCAKLCVICDIEYSNNEVDYRILSEAQLCNPGSVVAPNDRYIHTVSGDLEHVRRLQAIDSGGPALTIDLDPTDQYIGAKMYHGRTYCLYDCSGGGHHLSLSEGASFHGCGFTGEGKAQFGGDLGDSITFYVQDDNVVIVKNVCGVTPYVP
jgi:PA domain